jgi:hypothetical protein
VRANASAGFSVVTYTGNGSAATVGHGLNAALHFIIVKRRNAIGSWRCWHSALSNTQGIDLNETIAAFTDDSFNSTIPTSSVFSLKGGVASVNASGSTYVAYCFAPVAGYSYMSSFVANANSDGPFVFCNFRPRFLLVKNTTRVGTWMILDTSRDPYNVSVNFLEANDADAEAATQPRVDFLSNGFKVRAGSGFTPNEVSGDVYIFAAFAESPFQYARAR